MAFRKNDPSSPDHPRKPATAKHPTAEDVYRDLVQHSQDLLCTHDLTGRMLSVNPLPARLLGYEVDEMLSQPMRSFLAPEYRDQFDEYLARVQRDGFAEGSMVLLTRNGQRRIWEYYNTLRTGDGIVPIVRGMAHDVTERVQAEHALKKSEERFRVALKNAPIVMFNQDQQLRYTWIYRPVLAWAEQECLGRTDAEIVGGEEGAWLTEIKASVLRNKEGTRSEVSVTFNNERYFYDLTVEPLWDRRGEVTGVTCAAVDITPLKRAQVERERLLAELQTALATNEYLAFHDALTGVPNRRLLPDRFQQALARADRSRAKVAVVALDLDNFKTINDTFGHNFGDGVLTSVVTRLRGRSRASDTLARTGGDEFTVLADVNDSRAARVLASDLQLVFSEPFAVEGKLVRVDASIGLALYPDDGRSSDELLAAADRSMYVAKHKKREGLESAALS